MTNKVKELTREVASLPSKEKLSLLNTLLTSLDQPDPQIDTLWKKEAESRIKAFKQGKIKAVPLQHALAKYRKAKAA
jgi:putative addiction module component (TIGR02574 family)